MDKYDYIIIGSGIAGLYTALLAKEQGSVLVITKGSIEDCNTRYAQGGIAAAIGKDDSRELHFRDTIAAGDGLCNAEAVRILTSEAPARIADLVNLEVPFDTANGEIALTKEAAHSVPRILHAGGDATGEHIEVTLSRKVRVSQIQVLEDCLVTEILVDNGAVIGVRALDSRTSLFETFHCRSLILATGGAGHLYKFSTNSDIATGDGIALAYKAGAEITDMEFFQFHPTALRMPGVTPFLISESVRGEGGVLRNVDGYRFMPDYHPDADLAPRDVVSRSIIYEMRKTSSDRVFVDVTHLPPYVVTTRFPHIYRFCLVRGLDITRGLIPVAPAAHYLMGGVKTNTWGETSIEGLFAVGEVACTGVHGANRLASNSLLEAVVFSQRVIERTTKENVSEIPDSEKEKSTRCSLSKRKALKEVPPANLSALQELMWDKAGIIRDRQSLNEALDILDAWQACLPEPTDRPSYELNNLTFAGRLVAESALAREESRGAHFRSDFSKKLPDWQRHLILIKK